MNKVLSINLIFLFTIVLFMPDRLFGQVERFFPRQGGSTELWRITNDPTLRNWSNYHNSDAWSPDGRYVCYEKYEPYDTHPEKKVCLYDLYEEKEIEIGKGEQPRWANNSNWLFYIKSVPRNASLVMWLDVDYGKLTQIAEGVEGLGETDCNDQWLYGFKKLENKTRNGVRIPIQSDSKLEILEGLCGSQCAQWIGNPTHPVIFYRDDHYDTIGGSRKTLYFEPTRIWCDQEGKNIRIGSPMIQMCHQSWSGDGNYHMHGNSYMSGRKWDEPFPSNLHVLSSIKCGDISPCGKSGRWVCGSGNYGPLQIADLRSGDGRIYLKAALSYKHDSYKYGYMKSSALIDNDSKGSADGTKIIFVSDYDLKDGPLTEITKDANATTDIIYVGSTEGFPSSGHLSIGNEIVGYKRKSSKTFEGLSRNMYNTTSYNLDGIDEKIINEFKERKSDEEFLKKYFPRTLKQAKAIVEKQSTSIRKGTVITSFDARLIPDQLRKNMKLPSIFASSDFPDDKDSPLLWQRRTDIYIAVVRLPDQPHFIRTSEKELELIPGENHWETYGYNIYKGGDKITKEPLRPGKTFVLNEAGTYTATAVEWSGLESKKSIPVKVKGDLALKIRFDKPADFSWTQDKWLLKGKEVSEEKAKKSNEAIKEIVHLVDGTIHREWYHQGQIEKRHDLNAEGKAIRRLTYKNGLLLKREYYKDGLDIVNREIFDEDGKFIIESIQYDIVNGVTEEINHFWYDKGCPVKFLGRGVRHIADKGPGLYMKEGENWVKKKSL